MKDKLPKIGIVMFFIAAALSFFDAATVYLESNEIQIQRLSLGTIFLVLAIVNIKMVMKKKTEE